jgi:hypothetical protein
MKSSTCINSQWDIYSGNNINPINTVNGECKNVNGLSYIFDQAPLINNNEILSNKITFNPYSRIYTIELTFKNKQGHSNMVEYYAANPIDRRYSYSGSALPFPSPEIAYDNTSNHGFIKCGQDGKISFNVHDPSPYYVGQGKFLMNPHVVVKCMNKTYTIKLGEANPYRSLTSFPDRPNRVEPR